MFFYSESVRCIVLAVCVLLQYQKKYIDTFNYLSPKCLRPIEGPTSDRGPYTSGDDNIYKASVRKYVR